MPDIQRCTQRRIGEPSCADRCAFPHIFPGDFRLSSSKTYTHPLNWNPAKLTIERLRGDLTPERIKGRTITFPLTEPQHGSFA